MAPDAIGGKERNVRKVAHAVVGIAQHSLPRRLRPSLATAAHNTVDGSQTGRASPGPAPFGNGSFKVLLSHRAVAKTAGTVGRGIAFKAGDQRTRARIIPRNFWNVGERGRKGRGVRGIPISAVRMGKRVAEVRSAHSHVIRAGRQCINSDSMRRC